MPRAIELGGRERKLIALVGRARQPRPLLYRRSPLPQEPASARSMKVAMPISVPLPVSSSFGIM